MQAIQTDGARAMEAVRSGRVLGVGGVFFRAQNPAGLAEWYREHLGLNTEAWGGTHGTSFAPVDMPKNSFTVWSVFPAETEYFGDARQAYMLNLVVDDLDAALQNVAAGGASVVPDREEHDFGRFGWFEDPEGNRVELWEPPEELPQDDDA
jgi:predicted enzyme related to lactoylglutathione lyase